MMSLMTLSEISKEIKAKYPAGTRLRCLHMTDPYHPVPDGTLGTVSHVDDIGTIHVDWDNGQSLGLAYEEDQYEKAE